MNPACEQESIRRLAGPGFDLLLVGNGTPLRPQAAVKVREYAGALQVHHELYKKIPDYSV